MFHSTVDKPRDLATPVESVPKLAAKDFQLGGTTAPHYKKSLKEHSIRDFVNDKLQAGALKARSAGGPPDSWRASAPGPSRRASPRRARPS